MYKLITAGFIIGSLSGCSLIPGMTNEDVRQERVISKAVWDLDCSKENINVLKINDTSYGVKGCGKKASYIMINCQSTPLNGDWADKCTAILNSADYATANSTGQPSAQITTPVTQ